MTILVTGGAGFIGGNFIRHWLHTTNNSEETVINLDKLTYAGNLSSFGAHLNNPRLINIRGDIADTDLVTEILKKYTPRTIINFAAETHVDRSINSPEAFVQTNVVGTYKLLESCKNWWQKAAEDMRTTFRFIHISTDEVFGTLDENIVAEENSPYRPNSPYSASKAASDHFVRAYHHTYGLPVITTNCGNNYGPFQYPEKLIPLMITRAVNGESLPIYGDGENIRDWIYVEDQCAALLEIIARGHIGQTYNIGGNQQKTNKEVVTSICMILDKLKPKSDGTSYTTQICFVGDRLGHDRRYALNTGKIRAELSWAPQEPFESGLEKTVRWYLENPEWSATI